MHYEMELEEAPEARGVIRIANGYWVASILVGIGIAENLLKEKWGSCCRSTIAFCIQYSVRSTAPPSISHPQNEARYVCVRVHSSSDRSATLFRQVRPPLGSACAWEHFIAQYLQRRQYFFVRIFLHSLWLMRT